MFFVMQAGINRKVLHYKDKVIKLFQANFLKRVQWISRASSLKSIIRFHRLAIDIYRRPKATASDCSE